MHLTNLKCMAAAFIVLLLASHVATKNIVIATAKDTVSTTPTITDVMDVELDELKCLNKGPVPQARRDLIGLVDRFCDKQHGRKMATSGDIERDTATFETPTYCVNKVGISIRRSNIKKGGTNQNVMLDSDVCRQQFRRIVDECDQSGEDVKHGGFLWAQYFMYNLQASLEGSCGYFVQDETMA